MPGQISGPLPNLDQVMNDLKQRYLAGGASA
jgi:hypothetical protein